MLDSSVDIPSRTLLSQCKQRGITNPEARRRLEAAMASLPKPPGNGHQPVQPQGPRYEIWMPWYKRLLAKGCARCGGEPSGWAQRQIQTPYRFKRFVLWMVNLAPRFASMVSVVTSKRVSSDQYAERQASCATCPAQVIQGRAIGDTVRETSYCGACECPKWYASRNAVRNLRSRWACPLKHHMGSDVNAVYRAHLDIKRATERAATADDGSSGSGGN